MTVPSHPDVARLMAARRSRAADAIGHLCDPAVLVVGVLLLVSLRAAGSLWPGLGWAALSALFCVGLPYAVLRLLVRRGTVTDRQVVIGHQRPTPLAAAVVSVVAGVAVLRWLGAPAPVTALVVAMLAGLATTTLVSLVYKASLHVAVAGGVTVVLVTELGVAWAALLPVVGLVAWARVRAGRHTVGQAAAGLVIGCVAAGTVYPPLAG